jgi:succinate dehydrogenase/fumarate reductase flavoprotein subunit
VEETLDAAAVRDLMWRCVGVFRSRDRLDDAVRRLAGAYQAVRGRLTAARDDREVWRRVNLLTVAWLIARAALRREESRGGHFRDDFPARNDQDWRYHAVDTRRPNE